MAKSHLPDQGPLVLVADVGGTNCRFALGRDGKVLTQTTQSYRNTGYASFYAALEAFLEQQNRPCIEICSIAIAGPVTGRVGALTNLNWQFDADVIERMTGAGRAVLLNDLEALGYALGGLVADDTLELNQENGASNRNGQSLIVGAGTGLNGCAVLAIGSSNPAVLRAEIGHSSMPFRLTQYLSTQCVPGDFATLEDFFCGARLATLYANYGGDPETTPQAITERHQSGQDPVATRAVGQMQHMLGLLCRELSYLYLPMDGIYLAGSVARGLLGDCAATEFLSAFQTQGKFSTSIAGIPVFLLTRDDTALKGCVLAVSGH